MPNLTIYVDQALAAKARLHKVPVSTTCQRALARQVRIAERRLAGLERAAHQTGRERPQGDGTSNQAS